MWRASKKIQISLRNVYPTSYLLHSGRKLDFIQIWNAFEMLKSVRRY